MRTAGLVHGLHGSGNFELLRRMSGASVVRLLLAQELMPVCLLMDVVLPITSTLLAVRVANSGVTALMGMLLIHRD